MDSWFFRIGAPEGITLLGWQWVELSVTREIEDKQIFTGNRGKRRRIENCCSENETGSAERELHRKKPGNSPMLSCVAEGLTPQCPSPCFSH
jgi:hypothetical protein